MAEQLIIEVTKKERQKVDPGAPATVYAEWRIKNDGIEHVAYHGMSLPIAGSIAETVAAYEPTARGELFNAVEAQFPGEYTL